MCVWLQRERKEREGERGREVPAGDNCYEENRTGCQNRQCYHAGTGGCCLRLGGWSKFPEGEDAELRRWPL